MLGVRYSFLYNSKEFLLAGFLILRHLFYFIVTDNLWQKLGTYIYTYNRNGFFWRSRSF